jgi:hypothetical protein
MSQDQTLFAKAAPVADADCETAGCVDPCGSREINPLTDLHSHGPEFLPPSLKADTFQLGLPERQSVEKSIQHII